MTSLNLTSPADFVNDLFIFGLKVINASAKPRLVQVL